MKFHNILNCFSLPE